MADIFDAAQALEQADREAALARFARTLRHMPLGGGVCDDCGDPIPDRRRKALPTARRCIDCQKVSEGKRT